jgi:hypothetical protein
LYANCLVIKLGDISVDGRILLKRISDKQSVKMRTGFKCVRTSVNFCVNSDATSGSITAAE